jgi:hypothetical protein
MVFLSSLSFAGNVDIRRSVSYDIEEGGFFIVPDRKFIISSERVGMLLKNKSNNPSSFPFKYSEVFLDDK